MATQITSKVQKDIDWYLNGLDRDARWAVDLATRWDDLEDLEQEDLVAEWPLTIDFLTRSLAYRDKDLMSPKQVRHLHAIRVFLWEHETVLAGVFGKENVMLEPPSEQHASL